jgi:hypothetical protein
MKTALYAVALSMAISASALAEPQKLNDTQLDSVQAGGFSINVNPQINTNINVQTGIALALAGSLIGNPSASSQVVSFNLSNLLNFGH